GASVSLGDVRLDEKGSATLQLANKGTEALQIDSISVVPTAPYFVTAPSVFPVLLNPGESTALNLSFAPSLSGAQTAEVRIVSNDPDNALFLLELDGRGIDWPFRYKNYLYSKDPQYLYGKLQPISDFWSESDRIQGLSRAASFAAELRNDLQNRA